MHTPEYSPSKPSILFTNLTLAARSGSELHILELAKAFLKKGWDVTCYTLVLAYPIQGHFKQAGINVVEFGEEDRLSSHYTVLYSQHHIVSDFIWDCVDVTFEKIVLSSLGPFSEHEKLPSFSSEADLQVFVSDETRQQNGLNISNCNSFVFPNSIDFSQLSTQAKRTLPNKPKRIAVISNHIASELMELGELVGPGTQINYLGIENQSVEITPELVASYDLVISIGRTVPLCFAVKTPLYCYDIFGGPGYITPTSIEKDYFFNFSGRSNRSKKNATQLFSDIIDGYERASSNTDYMQKYAMEKLNFETNFEHLYSRITSSENQTPAQHRQKCSELVAINRKSQCMSFIDNYSCMLGLAQLFFTHNGASINEENSVLFKYCYRTTIEATHIIQDNFDKGECVRFDPDIRPVYCKLFSGTNAIPHNSERTSHELDVFITEDPIYDGKMDELTFSCIKLSEYDLCQEYRRLRAESDASLAQLEAELNSAKKNILQQKEPLPKKLLSRLHWK